MAKLGPEVKLISDILDLKYPFFGLFQPLKLYSIKKRISQKKIYHDKYFSIIWAKIPTFY